MYIICFHGKEEIIYCHCTKWPAAHTGNMSFDIYCPLVLVTWLRPCISARGNYVVVIIVHPFDISSAIIVHLFPLPGHDVGIIVYIAIVTSVRAVVLGNNAILGVRSSVLTKHGRIIIVGVVILNPSLTILAVLGTVLTERRMHHLFIYLL